jgi:hypothetical protein
VFLSFQFGHSLLQLQQCISTIDALNPFLIYIPHNIECYLTMRVKKAPVAPQSPDGICLRSNLFNKDRTSEWSLSQAKRELQGHHVSESQAVTSQAVGNQSTDASSQNNTVVLGTPEPNP